MLLGEASPDWFEILKQSGERHQHLSGQSAPYVEASHASSHCCKVNCADSNALELASQPVHIPKSLGLSTRR